jgi:enoyl-CoA hydratase
MERIKYEINCNIARITMDDGKANAMNPDLLTGLGNAMDRCIEENASVLIISGREGFFSGGLDLKLMSKITPDDLREMLRMFSHTLLKVFALPIPTIAVCTGHAIAGGAMLSYACDLRYAIDGPFRIHMNELETGIAPLPTWMLLIGRSAIPTESFNEALMHARPYSPKEAYERNIFNGLASDADEIINLAAASADNLAKLNKKAYALSKERMRKKEVEEARILMESEIDDLLGV